MDAQYFPFYGLALAIGSAALWWFVLPDWPEVAVEDSILAGAVASVVTGFCLRLF